MTRIIIVVVVILGLVIGLSLSLKSCVETVSTVDATPTATEELDEAVQFLVEIQKAQATAQSIESTQVWLSSQQTATAQVQYAAATQQAAVATSQAERAIIAQTERAFAVGATATHEAFTAHQAATGRAWNVTTTAQAVGTATAYPQTATADSQHLTATQIAWETTATMDAAYGWAQATSAWGGAESVRLANEREQVTNMTRAWLPWMGFVVALALISVVGIRWSRMRVVAKDAFGATPTLVMDGVVVDMDTTTSMRRLRDGNVEWTENDKARTARAQKVQMVRSLPPGKPDETAMQILNMPEERPALPVVERVPSSEVGRVILDEISDQVIEEE